MLHETHETAASQWICRAPARDVGKAKSYQWQLSIRPLCDRYVQMPESGVRITC